MRSRLLSSRKKSVPLSAVARREEALHARKVEIYHAWILGDGSTGCRQSRGSCAVKIDCYLPNAKTSTAVLAT